MKFRFWKPKVQMVQRPMRKSQMMAFTLALFTGGLGGHLWYTGRYGYAALYAAFCWTAIPSIISLGEAGYLLTHDRRWFAENYSPWVPDFMLTEDERDELEYLARMERQQPLYLQLTWGTWALISVGLVIITSIVVLLTLQGAQLNGHRISYSDANLLHNEYETESDSSQNKLWHTADRLG